MIRHPRDSAARPRAGQAEKDKSRDKSPHRTPDKGAGAEKAERVAKALARAGIASRREVERLINLGKVAVNGRVLDTPAVLVKADDILTVEGKVVGGPEPTRLWRYHKQAGLVTTHRDPQGRPTVFEHLPEGLPRVISVGRLDLNTEGLLLLTNDGALSRALELPSSGWRRVYRARAYGRTTQAELDRLQDGITLEGVRYGPIEAKLDKAETKADGRANLWITVSLAEGKNREVRRVLEALGLKVNRLIRLAYGPFQLGTLEPGTAEEIGPRVIREQLADLIAPENLPKGDRVPGPAARPGRRPTGAVGAPPRGSGDPLADPNRKPSRVRVQLAAAREALENPPERPRDDDRRGPARDRPYGRGAPRGRDFEGDRGERPRPARGGYGDKPYGKGAPRGRGFEGGEGERPRPARGGFGAKPYGKGAPRGRDFEGGEGERPRPERGGFGAKPYGKGAPRGRDFEGGEGERPRPERGGFGDKPRGKGPPRGRDFEGGEGDRPRPERGGFGDKPRGKGPPRGRSFEGGEGDRPRPERGGFGDKPRGKGPPRGRGFEGGEGDRPRPARGGFGDKPHGKGAPRGRDFEGGEGERPRPARGGFGPKPYGKGPPRGRAGDGGEGAQGDRPRPARGGFGPKRSGGEGGFGGGKGRPGGGDRPKGFGPKGPRPKGPRPPRG